MKKTLRKEIKLFLQWVETGLLPKNVIRDRARRLSKRLK